MRDLSTLAAGFYRVKMCTQIDEIQRELKLRKKVTTETLAKLQELMQTTNTLLDPDPPKSTDRINYSDLLRSLRH